MPTVLRSGPYRFFVYSNEGSEPPHVHVQRDRALAKFWLRPVAVASSSEFPGSELRQIERLIAINADELLEGHGMTSSLPRLDARAKHVRTSSDELSVFLADGRRVSVPLAWFPRLLHATPAERENWQLLGDGEGIHWPDLDEDLSVAGLLEGRRER